VTGFSLRYVVVEHLYRFWLAPDSRSRRWAAGRLLGVPALRRHPGAPGPTLGERLRHTLRGLPLTVKVLAYQAACLALGPLRRD
jgi:hypothetical protein